jgi:hypothetical protein
VEGVKQRGSGPEWFDNGIAAHSSRSARKAASAMIAKIPQELSRYIARFYRPHEAQLAGRVGCEVSGERTQ